MPPKKDYKGAERTSKSEIGLGKDERPQNARSMGMKSVVGANDLQEPQRTRSNQWYPSQHQCPGSDQLSHTTSKTSNDLWKALTGAPASMQEDLLPSPDSLRRQERPPLRRRRNCPDKENNFDLNISYPTDETEKHKRYFLKLKGLNISKGEVEV